MIYFDVFNNDYLQRTNESMNKHLNVISTILVLLIVSNIAMAEEDALTCTTNKVVSCLMKSKCVTVTRENGLDDVRMTYLLSEKKAILRVDEELRPPSIIDSIKIEEEITTMIGSRVSEDYDNRTIYWIAVINTATGNMTVSATQDDLGILMFGHCVGSDKS